MRGMQEVMGPLPGKEKRCPLSPQIKGETDCGSYVLISLSYSAEPDSSVPAYLLVPKAAFERNAKLPAVLALHQTHSLGNKVVVGLGNSPNDQ